MPRMHIISINGFLKTLENAFEGFLNLTSVTTQNDKLCKKWRHPKVSRTPQGEFAF